MKVLTWNVEWATPRSKRSVEILDRISQRVPEIVCLTETDPALMQGGHRISARPDYGYGIRNDRRKVVLWSREPWDRVDDIGDDRMPPGRFVSGVTSTSLGEITVVGLCIPWSGSRRGKRFGSESRRTWEDHEEYLEHLGDVLRRMPSKRLLLMGDFNQRVGEHGTASRLRSALQRAIPPHVTVATYALGHQGRRTIDHIGLSADMVVESMGVIGNYDGGRKLSDHFGIVADLSVRES